MLGLTAVIVAMFAVVYPTVRDQMLEFVMRLPDLFAGFVDWLRDIGLRVGIDLDEYLRADSWEAWLADPANQETIRRLLFGFGAGAGLLIRGVTEVVVIVGLAPVLAVYVLMDLTKFQSNAIALTPAAYREEVAHVGGKWGRRWAHS
jgi:predicted PurR-regulated permease PerM